MWFEKNVDYQIQWEWTISNFWWYLGKWEEGLLADVNEELAKNKSSEIDDNLDNDDSDIINRLIQSNQSFAQLLWAIEIKNNVAPGNYRMSNDQIQSYLDQIFPNSHLDNFTVYPQQNWKLIISGSLGWYKAKDMYVDQNCTLQDLRKVIKKNIPNDHTNGAYASFWDIKLYDPWSNWAGWYAEVTNFFAWGDVAPDGAEQVTDTMKAGAEQLTENFMSLFDLSSSEIAPDAAADILDPQSLAFIQGTVNSWLKLNLKWYVSKDWNAEYDDSKKNRTLSQNRADAIKQLLVDNWIPAESINASSWWVTDQFWTNLEDNRRVTFDFAPNSTDV